MISPSILVVDDEKNTRLGISFTLQEEGVGDWIVDVAENGKQALELLRKQKYGVLITDIKMPILNGIELLKKLDELNIEVTSLMLTGFADFEFARKGMRFGVVDYLLKPVQQDELINSVKKALEIAKTKKDNKVGKLLLDHGFGDALTKEKSNNASVNLAVEFIRNNLNTGLAIKDVAEHVYLNPNYLSVLFKEEKGITFSDFVTNERIRKAKELLIVSDMSLEEITERIGYQTTSYFIRVFKKLEGLTPNQYRNEFFENGKLKEKQG